MKKLILTIILVGCMVVPAFAAPTINFAQFTGSFDYSTVTQTFTFNPIIGVTQGLGNPGDPLVGNEVLIPSLLVSGSTVSPSGSSTLIISNGSIDFLTGTLGTGNLVDGGQGVLLYSTTINDLTAIGVNQTTPPSPALAQIQDMLNAGGTSLNIAITLSDTTGANILTDGSTGGSISGTISTNPTIPAPGAIVLGGIGSCLVGWLRKRRAL